MTRSISIRLTPWILFFLLASGCASTTDYEIVQVPDSVMTAYLQNKPSLLHYHYIRILQEGRRNLVLNHMRAGLAAMELGEFDLAEESFDIALLNIESIYTDDENAAKARSLWYEEGRKDFKGEPYERAMAYYYRGLLYLRKGDYENARASFKGGLLQDAMAEQAIYQADFALLIFLEGWSSLMLGDWDMAEEAFQEVQKYRPDFVIPPRDHNVLLIAETGHGPQKIAVGRGGAALRFTQGYGFREDNVRFATGGTAFPGFPMEDIFWQANTRGGRQVDHILAGKVQFQETNQAMGQTLTHLSLATLAMSPQFGDDAGIVAIVAGIIGLVGLGQQAVAERTQTQADTRYWENLPNRVHVATLNSTDRDQDLRVEFLKPNGRRIVNLDKETTITFVNDRSGFAWVRPHQREAGPRHAGPVTRDGNIYVR
ncbi:MAG: tetratricopeptide repeat protein [Nitrospinae bacterium]|nr:tetratricopeptide repeat protein [Nitrospinota bacterium]